MEGERREAFDIERWITLGRNRMEISFKHGLNSPGAHHLLYSIYSDSTILLTGGEVFDLGTLFLESVRTDKEVYYSKGPIILKMKVMGEGKGRLSILLGEDKLLCEDTEFLDGMERRIEIKIAGEHRLVVRCEFFDTMP